MPDLCFNQNQLFSSLKWYKDGQEFYSYIPRLSESKRYFNVSGVQVDVSFYFFIFDREVCCVFWPASGCFTCRSLVEIIFLPFQHMLFRFYKTATGKVKGKWIKRGRSLRGTTIWNGPNTGSLAPGVRQKEEKKTICL